jgi:arginase family enzyme
MPQLSPENVVLIGVREVAPAEAGPLRESALTVFTIADIDALGIREVMRQALRRASAGTRGLYVSYSPTATDLRAFAPGSGGMTPRETHMAMEIIAQSTRPLAMDVVGLEPGQDPGVARECAGFVLSCFGKRIL